MGVNLNLFPNFHYRIEPLADKPMTQLYPASFFSFILNLIFDRILPLTKSVVFYFSLYFLENRIFLK